MPEIRATQGRGNPRGTVLLVADAGLAPWRAPSPICIGNVGATWLRRAGSRAAAFGARAHCRLTPEAVAVSQWLLSQTALTWRPPRRCVWAEAEGDRHRGLAVGFTRLRKPERRLLRRPSASGRHDLARGIRRLRAPVWLVRAPVVAAGCDAECRGQSFGIDPLGQLGIALRSPGAGRARRRHAVLRPAIERSASSRRKGRHGTGRR